ncbi:MAG: PAS domain S-box protein [Candidatus Binatia bacterium]
MSSQFSRDSAQQSTTGFHQHLIERTIELAHQSTAQQTSEARFRHAFEYAPVGMALLTLEGRWYEVNAALRAMLGYSEMELRGTTVQALTHPDDVQADEDNLRRLVAGETVSYQREKRYRHKQGHDVWVLVNVAMVRETPERAPYLTAYIQDISARKHAEEAVRRQRYFADSLIDTAQVIILVLDPQGRIVRYNPYMETLSGYSLSEVQGKDWFTTFVPPREHDYLRPLFRQAVDSVQTRGAITPIIIKDGSERLIQWYDATLSDGNGQVTSLLSIGIDVTERQRSQIWLQALIDTTQDAVVSIDAHGHIKQFNRAAERMFGYSTAEVQGQKVNLLMPDSYATEHDQYLAHYHATREPRAIGRVRKVTAQRKNGEVFPIELSIVEVKLGAQARYSAFIRDISATVQLQEQIIEKERLAAIGTTAATLAHEIGNPLNGMALSIQLLERRLGTLMEDETVQRSVRSLRTQTFHLANLLAEFRLLSRPKRLILRPTDLGQLVREVLTAEMPLHSAQGVTVKHHVTPDLPLLHVDPDKLRQVVLNLCKNATEAMPEGGTLTVALDTAGAYVQLTMTDTGTGIADGVNIFEPFVTTKKDGSGLGLAIVRQIVAAHGGTLTYTSALGQGTRFVVSLPGAGEPGDTADQ